ncbi:MAG: HAD-IA family hydrolase [Gammaproteobacteria bacterium]|nr:HAD-IA family hydrolase [Gammaproteobacteria bacterium]
MSSSKTKLIIFDWDGTLMDSIEHIVNSMQGAITDMQYEHKDEETIRNIIGLGMHEAILALFPGCEQTERLKFIDSYREYFFERSHNSDFYPGALNTIHSLKKQDYLLAVATSKGRNGLDRAFNNYNLVDTFHTSRCADETQSKPHPQMLEEILEELQIKPQEAVMVGDTAYDMEMARNANVPRIACCYGVHSREKLMAYEPAACMQSIYELENVLASEFQCKITNVS